MDYLWAIQDGVLSGLCSRLSRGYGRVQSSDSRRNDPTTIVGSVAVIPVAGVLAKDQDIFQRLGLSDRPTLVDVEAAIKRAAADDDVAGIVLHIDSPGGTMAGTPGVAEAVFAARQAKPVIAWVPDLAASAAQLIASQAQRIVIGPAATMGSIGVYTVVHDMTKLAEKEGIAVEVFRSDGSYMKGAGEPGTALTDDQRAEIQRHINGMNDRFVQYMMRGRGMSRDQVKALNTGQTWIGSEAIAHDLADEVGTIERAVLLAHGSDQSNRSVGTLPMAVAGTQAQVYGDITMKLNAKQLDHLRSLGCINTDDEATVTAFVAGLDESHRQKLEGLGKEAVEPKAVQQPEPKPKAQAQSAPQQPSAVDVVASERNRVAAIRQVGRMVSMSQDMIDTAIDNGVEADKFRSEALAFASAKLAPIAGLGQGDQISGGSDKNLESLPVAVEHAIWRRMGMTPPKADENGNIIGEPVYDEKGKFLRTRALREEKLHDRSREFAGRSLSELVRGYLSAHGKDVAGKVSGLPASQVCQMAFNRNLTMQAMGASSFSGHTTSDFGAVLENIISKTLRAAYVEATSNWEQWARRVTAPDFKTISRTQLGEVPGLKEIKEMQEIPELSFGDAKENYFLKVFAGIFSVSWQTLINDDLNAFARVAQMMGNSGRRKENVLAYSVLTSNPTMGDGNALFSSQHSNLASGTGNVGAPSVALLNKVHAAMGTQTGLTDDSDEPIILDLDLAGIIVPRALEGTAWSIANSTSPPTATHSGEGNKWQGLNIVSSGRLDQDSTTAWYGFASNKQIDTVELAFLEGMEQPMVTQEDAFSQLGRRFRVVHALEAKAIDWKGLYKNPGA